MRSLDYECNNACDTLPDGYDLTIFLEQGAGWVELQGPDGEICELDLDDMTLAAQVAKSVEYAIWEAEENSKRSLGKSGSQP